MTEPVPVSPAAQAVDGGGPPDLWWSPGLAADTLDAQDGVVTNDRGQLYRQQNATWRYIEALPADAVRLVPAPGPDTEADDEKTPAAGPERITISLDTLWSCILVGVSGLDGVVPPTRRINAAVRLAHRAAARDEAAGVRTDGETSQ